MATLVQWGGVGIAADTQLVATSAGTGDTAITGRGGNQQATYPHTVKTDDPFAPVVIEFSCASTAQSYIYWDLGETKSDIGIRLYVKRLSGDAGNAHQWCRLGALMDDGTAAATRLAFSGSGDPNRLRMYYGSSGSFAASGSNSTPAGEWYRIEAYVKSNAGTPANGQRRILVYSGHSTTPIHDSGWATASMGTGIRYVNLGCVVNSTTPDPLRFAHIAVTDDADALIGPYELPEPPTEASEYVKTSSGLKAIIAEYVKTSEGLKLLSDPEYTPPPNNILGQWNMSPLPTWWGSAVSLDESRGFPSPASVRLEQAADNAVATQWSFGALSTVSVRFYMLTPTSWHSSGNLMVAAHRTAAGARSHVRLSGASARTVRLCRQGGVLLAESPADTLSLNTWYRVELQQDSSLQRARCAVFNTGSDTPLWDSDWQTHSDFSEDISSVLLGTSLTTPVGNPYNIDSVLIVGAVGPWIGCAAGDVLV